MKEFEKWWRSNDRQSTMCADIAAKTAWKAALRWAKAMHDVVNEPRFNCVIREELSGE